MAFCEVNSPQIVNFRQLVMLMNHNPGMISRIDVLQQLFKLILTMNRFAQVYTQGLFFQHVVE